MQDDALSRLLSLILRHEPAKFGLSPDPGGWIATDLLLAALAERHGPVTRDALERVVATNDKQRFQISPDGQSIRAVQGHSFPADLGLFPVAPPPRLFHGTVSRALSGIRAEGLRPGRRRYVHLSPDVDTARSVGRRRGSPVVLVVDAERMSKDGHAFLLSANGVWLAPAVPAIYIEFPPE